MKLLRRGLLAGAAITASAAAIIIPLASAPAGAATTGFTATQSVTNRDDSGANGGNWATDQFTRKTHFVGRGIVLNSNCPGITIGSCHKFTGTLTDRGTFTTNPGNLVPGSGSLNGNPAPVIGTAVTGPMRGHIAVTFYANVALAKASAGNAPPSVSGDSPSTGQWVTQFFPAGTEIWDSSGNEGVVGSSLGSLYTGGNGSWTYTEAPGANPACPNEASRWVDASPDWGGLPADGNILAQDAAHC